MKLKLNDFYNVIYDIRDMIFKINEINGATFMIEAGHEVIISKKLYFRLYTQGKNGDPICIYDLPDVESSECYSLLLAIRHKLYDIYHELEVALNAKMYEKRKEVYNNGN